MSAQLPPDIKPFGPDSNCDLNTCPVELSLYTYRPSLAANATFLALFVLIGLVHGYLGYRWRSWGFMVGMLLGCMSEVIGYAGRIMLYNNPFSFAGFMIQIVCLTIAPVFYTASIYVTLSKTILHFAPELSRFNPIFFYWIFIPFDVVCLALQAAGGALSTNSTGADRTGVDISMAGLALQVIVLTAFAACFADYMIRYVRSDGARKFDWRLRSFFGGLVTATLLILARCAYRVAELKDGYDGDLIHEEAPFIVLEGVLIVLAAVALCFGHPGLVFGWEEAVKGSGFWSEEGGGGGAGEVFERK
ncbi:hypothetical protein E4U43_004520 [Claviceps pusilla]|uniref:Uncharacterized protein n=1 Tax=Claviceps pusilla TaxID=123648 RepID=A0A9P7N5P8_9HYPO|nr:hypothetical protein E4U43_004520 [Claviceps pusilla]